MQTQKSLKSILGLSAITMGLYAANAAAFDCSGLENWQEGKAYVAGNKAQKSNIAYEANWWTQADPATHSVHGKNGKIWVIVTALSIMSCPLSLSLNLRTIVLFKKMTALSLA